MNRIRMKSIISNPHFTADIGEIIDISKIDPDFNHAVHIAHALIKSGYAEIYHDEKLDKPHPPYEDKVINDVMINNGNVRESKNEIFIQKSDDIEKKENMEKTDNEEKYEDAEKSEDEEKTEEEKSDNEILKNKKNRKGPRTNKP
jgi:uncharacterized protein YdaT